MDEAPSLGPFAPTRWTLVLRAGGGTSEGRAALAELCAIYYEPVLRFLRREGRDEDSARELAQEFFTRILQRGELGQADRGRGRFRSYLLGAVKHFLADRRDYDRRLKRGGGGAPQPLDPPDAEPGAAEALQLADDTAEEPGAFFDRQWALALMDRALSRVQGQFQSEGKAELFQHLNPWLAGDFPGISQAEAAARLGWSESALKVAIHRLRKRFRATLRQEIAHTVNERDDIDAELRYLVDLLAKSS